MMVLANTNTNRENSRILTMYVDFQVTRLLVTRGDG
jgi:hypothetical protein